MLGAAPQAPALGAWTLRRDLSFGDLGSQAGGRREAGPLRVVSEGARGTHVQWPSHVWHCAGTLYILLA